MRSKLHLLGQRMKWCLDEKKMLKLTKKANDNEMLNGVMEGRDSCNTFLMEVQMIFAELSLNSFALA